MEDMGGKMARIRGMDCAEKPACEMIDQRDVDAAHILVELANGVLSCPKNSLGSLRRDLGMVQKTDGKLSTTTLSDNSWQLASRSMGNGKMKKETAEKSNLPFQKTNNPERKQKKRKVGSDFSSPQSKKYRNYFVTENEKEKDLTCRLAKKSHPAGVKSCDIAGHDGLAVKYFGSKMATKKRQVKEGATYLDEPDEYANLHSGPKEFIAEHSYLKKKKGSRKPKIGSLGSGIIYSKPLSRRGIMDDVVPVIKPAKKQIVTLITPTLHTNFSFSIIHLLSAVRMALVARQAQDYSLSLEKLNKEGKRRLKQCNITENEKSGGVSESQSHEMALEHSSPLTIHQIVQSVRSKPGDPRILETKEPLLDLVRGVLKMFSSKIAPLGAKGWKALTMYERSSKSWSWVGPVSFKLSHDNCIKEETSPEAWGLHHRILVKLVDCFANWLNKVHETLRQIGNLPAPPMTLMQPTKSEERFKDLRTQRSLVTIKPSCDEVRDYFHREEALRYLIPDRAFSYTAVDGRKTTVAPLRRCSGKPSGKARDHFLLKINRPPHVTVLCLVRDAAARLPASIGTRADVCTLVKDSQYIVDDISDSQINQVVSGALDRLHYEFDPCVQFDRNRHLWVYLHGEREEEEFENDGSPPRKKATCN